MLSYCVGQRVDGAGGLSSTGVGMDAHAAEVVPEARLHERTRVHVERFAWRLQHIVDNRWRRCWRRVTGFTLQAQERREAAASLCPTRGSPSNLQSLRGAVRKSDRTELGLAVSVV